MYGTDYIYCESLGFETNPDGSPKWNASKQYGLAMPQVYGEMGVGKLSAKLGRFYTPIGYESMMATSNFFYSMNYALRYAEPTTHTGGVFTWKTSDELSLYCRRRQRSRRDRRSDRLACRADRVCLDAERQAIRRSISTL